MYIRIAEVPKGTEAMDRHLVDGFSSGSLILSASLEEPTISHAREKNLYHELA